MTRRKKKLGNRNCFGGGLDVELNKNFKVPIVNMFKELKDTIFIRNERKVC